MKIKFSLLKYYLKFLIIFQGSYLGLIQILKWLVLSLNVSDPQPPAPDCDPPCDWPEYCWGGKCTIPGYDLVFIIGIICVASMIIGKKTIKKYKKQ